MDTFIKLINFIILNKPDEEKIEQFISKRNKIIVNLRKSLLNKYRGNDLVNNLNNLRKSELVFNRKFAKFEYFKFKIFSQYGVRQKGLFSRGLKKPVISEMRGGVVVPVPVV